MFCIYCGTNLPEGAEVCPVCGSKSFIADNKSETQSSVPVQPAEPLVLEAPTEAEAATQEIPVIPSPMPDEDEQDVFSTGGQHFRPEAEMEDIYSSGGTPTPNAGGYRETYNIYGTQQNIPYEDDFEYEEYEEKRPKKKRSFLWVLIVIPILLAVIGTTAGILVWYNAPIQQFNRALEENNYAQITQLLPQLEEEELSEVSAYMKTYAQELVQKYNKGEVDYTAAYELVERLQRLFPDVPELQRAVETMKTLKASKETFASAQNAEKNKDVDDALRLYAAVVQEDVNYETAQERITAIKAEYKVSVLEEAQRLADEKDFLGAQAVLTESGAILGDDPDIAAKMTELQEMEQENYVVSMLETAQQLADEGDLIGAVRLLEEAIKEDERFTQQITVYKQTYKDEKLQEAAKLAQQSDFEEAVAVLENAKAFLGDDADLNEKIREYKDMYPVLLIKLNNTGGENCASGWTASAVNGNTYSNGLSFALYPMIAEDVYTEYTPGGKYKRFSGTWVVESDTTEGFIGEIRVYVDGSLQYTLSSLTRNSTPAEMNLKIEGAHTIRIEAEGAFAGLRETGYIYLAGATFRN